MQPRCSIGLVDLAGVGLARQLLPCATDCFSYLFPSTLYHVRGKMSETCKKQAEVLLKHQVDVSFGCQIPGIGLFSILEVECDC